MGEVYTPSGREPAFRVLPGAGGYYAGYTSEIDGTDPYSQDIRDADKGYTVNFQRYQFIHSARYFIIRFQPSTRTNGLERLRVRLYQGDINMFSRDFETSDFGSFYSLIADLGTPSYSRLSIDLKIGFLKQWKIPGFDGLVFRLSRVYLTDFLD